MAQVIETEVEREAIDAFTNPMEEASSTDPDEELSDERRGASLTNPSWKTIATVILVGAALILLYFYVAAAAQSSLSIFHL